MSGDKTKVPNIYLIRHGATEWSVSGQHTGRTDIPLTAKGEAEAQALKTRIAHLTPELVLSSPLQRAKRTADVVGFPNIQLEPNLLEWNYGKYDGLKTAEIHEQNPGWNIFEDGCPEGESVTDVEKRVQAVIARVRQANVDTALFAHGHVLRVFVACWLGLSPKEGRRFVLGTASLSILSYEHGSLDEPALKLWNATS